MKKLEEVKRQFWEEGDLSISGFEFLLAQAERVEELENQYDEQLEESQKTYDYFKSEIERYKQALETIAEDKNTVYAAIAMKALEQKL